MSYMGIELNCNYCGKHMAILHDARIRDWVVVC
ncbi:MAG: hypothetical protein UR19_C0015G0005 [Candidatus Nomurabacteria bacterium GW2011_GWF1_31_48]|uniref:Uncharacterized protein n=1 Tax=Candidatus Nomurabacteria bacterium GW2011_GWF1_31_48 TaxID=1618767 RepID=A0A0F9YCM7_9BACT|nr:MAG: hypothetical protein UR19_C0015G0005 [Candidatus Nomurabacteria bacterium GW2011_GWF1_31_48]